MEIKEEFKIHIKDMVKALPVTLFFKDTEGKYVFSTGDCNLINAGQDETIIGKRDIDIQYDKALGQKYYEEDMRILKTGESTDSIDLFHDTDGNEIYLEIMKKAIRDDNGKIIGICGICNDVTKAEKQRQKYKMLSFHDPLTGAYNRNYFEEHVFDNAESLPCSYIFCDCNNLKKINDNFGHDMGDKYIIEAHKVLNDSICSNSVIIRWGGDEFLIITPNCDVANHEEIMKKIAESQGRLADIKSGMGISIGGVVRESLDTAESVVMKLSDRKMYENKKSYK